MLVSSLSKSLRIHYSTLEDGVAASKMIELSLLIWILFSRLSTFTCATTAKKNVCRFVHHLQSQGYECLLFGCALYRNSVSTYHACCRIHALILFNAVLFVCGYLTEFHTVYVMVDNKDLVNHQRQNSSLPY